MLDVPGNEPGHPGAGRALRLDLEPQLRGSAGSRWAHAPRQPADGCSRGRRGALRRHPGLVMKRTFGAVWQQEETVAGFIDERRRLIPLFDIQEALVRRLITRNDRTVSRFCDLGAGDGGFAELIMDAFPGSTGVLVDFSEPMLAAAESR